MEEQSYLPNWDGDNWIAIAAQHQREGNDVLSFSELYKLCILSEIKEVPLAHSVTQAYQTVSELTNCPQERAALLRMFTVFYYGTDTLKNGPYGIEPEAYIAEFTSIDRYDQLCMDLQRLEDDLFPPVQLTNGESSFLWMGHDHKNPKMLAFSRQSETGEDFLFVVNRGADCLYDFRVGVKETGYYNELLNSDSGFYGGNDYGNGGGVHAQEVSAGYYQNSISIVAPAYSTLIFQRVSP